jgi:hypothetical protein
VEVAANKANEEMSQNDKIFCSATTGMDCKLSLPSRLGLPQLSVVARGHSWQEA